MIYRINVTPPAVIDVQGIQDFIAESSPEAADRILDLFEKTFEALANFPKRHPLAPESQTESTEIRQTFAGNYRILFKIINDTVHVLRVRHGAQQQLKPGELN